ncbi:retrovirus-related pol polyprotein from transposon TNT 1-94 [Tanacetum coccineum]
MYHERALLANQKSFYKRSGRVGSARKPIDKSKETCFTHGKLGHFQKDCPTNKTSTPSYPSSNNYKKPKSYTPSFNQTSSQNTGDYQKDYKGKYKGLKAEIVVLTKRIDDLTKGNNEKGKSEKGLMPTDVFHVETSYVVFGQTPDEVFVSSEDEGTTNIRELMAITEDEPSVEKADARSGQWVDITMKKVHIILSMTDGDERKHVIDYTHVDLDYVEDQRKNLVNKFNLLKQELSLHKSKLCNLKNTVSINCSLQNEVIRVNLENESLKDEISDLKKVIEKWTCSKVPLDQLLFEQIPDNIFKALGGREPLSPLPKLIGAAPTGTSDIRISLADLTLNMADLTLNTSVPKKTKPTSVKVSHAYVIKKKTENKSPAIPKSCSDKKADSSTEQLLLTLMEEVKGLKRQIEIPSGTYPLNSQSSSSKSTKQKTWFGPCKHCGLRNHLSDDCYSKPKCSTYGSTDHLTKEHLEHAADYLKRSVWYLDSGCSRHIIGVKQYLHIYSKESSPKVVFRDDSSGDTEGYGSVKCNGITFTRVAYVNGLKHNLINISQLCDANLKVLFIKTQGTIFNQNDEIVLIAPRIRDVYIIDMYSYNKESNTYEFSRYTWVFCLKKKSDAADCIMSFIRKMENLNEVKVKELRSDNGTDTEGDAIINFNENRSFPDDEFLERRSKVTPCPGNIEYFPYIPAYENITLTDSPILQDSVSLKDPPEFTDADDHPTLNDLDQPESSDNLEPAEIQDNVTNEPISDVQPSLIISPSTEGEHLAGITTRSRVRDSKSALAHECLYVNFLSEMEPKKLVEALEEEGWIIAMQ